MSDGPWDVNEQAVEDWIAETTAFDRVQSVMRRTYEPETVEEIAERARLDASTARKHLQSLADDGFIETVQTAGTRYKRSEESRAVEALLHDLEHYGVNIESVLADHESVAKFTGFGERWFPE